MAEDCTSVVTKFYLCYAPAHNDFCWISQSVVMTIGVGVWAVMIATITTVGELAAFIAASAEVPAALKPFLLSALNRVRLLLGQGQPDVSLEGGAILRRLERLSPAMAGMLPQSLANVRSRFRRAL